MRYRAERIGNHHGQNHSATCLPQGSRIRPGRGTRVARGCDDGDGGATDARSGRAGRARPGDVTRAVHPFTSFTDAYAARPDHGHSHSYVADRHAHRAHDRDNEFG